MGTMGDREGETSNITDVVVKEQMQGSGSHGSTGLGTGVYQGQLPEKRHLYLDVKNGSKLRWDERVGPGEESFSRESTAHGKTLKLSAWGNDPPPKIQKATEGPLAVTQCDLAFLNRFLWQRFTGRERWETSWRLL